MEAKGGLLLLIFSDLGAKGVGEALCGILRKDDEYCLLKFLCFKECYSLIIRRYVVMRFYAYGT